MVLIIMVFLSVTKHKRSYSKDLEQAKEFKNYIIEQYQQIGDLDEMAQKLAIETSGKNKFNFLSLELETTIAKTVIRKVLG